MGAGTYEEMLWVALEIINKPFWTWVRAAAGASCPVMMAFAMVATPALALLRPDWAISAALAVVASLM